MKQELFKWMWLAGLVTGALLLLAAYLLIWQKWFVAALLRIASAIACALMGGILFFGCLLVLVTVLFSHGNMKH